METKTTKLLLLNLTPDLSSTITNNFSRPDYVINTSEHVELKDFIESISDYQLIVAEVNDDEYTLAEWELIIRSNPSSEFIFVDDKSIISGSITNLINVFDTISNEIAEDDLCFRINRAITTQKNRSELIILKQQVAMNYGFDNLIGNSKQTDKLKESIRNIAPTDINVLISGPTGCGKTLVANIIHHHSDRRKKSFITVDCSTIPDTLLEETIFGANNSPTDFGLIDTSNGGTLFIKDVDKMSYRVQQRFFQFLQTGSITKSVTDETRKFNVRVVSSTEAKMSHKIKNDTFMEELAYRLGEINLVIPSLSERIEDIEQIAEYFTRRISSETGRPMYTISRGALELLFKHPWPGNVRELENTMKRATALSKNSTIEESDILFIESGQVTPVSVPFENDDVSNGKGLLDEGQRKLIIKTLKSNRWNYSQTAQDLGIGRTTLWRKVKKYNLKKEEYEQV